MKYSPLIQYLKQQHGVSTAAALPIVIGAKGAILRNGGVDETATNYKLWNISYNISDSPPELNRFLSKPHRL